MKKTYREETQELAPEWAKDWPTRIIRAMDWRYFATEFKDMTKEAVIKDITAFPFEKTYGIGPTMRRQICELLGVKYSTKAPTKEELRIVELEAQVAELERRNQILLMLAKEVRSDPSDCDLVTHANGFQILHKMYGGYAIQPPKSVQWETIDKFEEVIERIYQHQGG